MQCIQAQKYPIGFKWDILNWNGQTTQKVIIDSKEKDGIIYYLVSNDEDIIGLQEVYTSDYIDQIIERDMKNNEYRAKALKELEIREQKEQAEKNILEDTNGFADQFKPMKRGKIINTLNHLKRVDGRIMTRKEWVREWVSLGYYPEFKTLYNPYSRGKDKKDEYTLTARDGHSLYVVTKTEYDYAVHLIKIGYNQFFLPTNQ
jgi:hypothetical protein